MISIHTLAWRVTPIMNQFVMTITDFNPHPRVEGDFTPYKGADIMAISIHTLAWRVTPLTYEMVIINGISIHTLAWRVTLSQE